MSRENTANSFASFGSDFDPEHEAIASTRELDENPRLPKMKGASSKLSQVDEEEEPDYVFNTSTFEQYLPNFSPIATSEEEEDHNIDDDISLEVGRGPSNPPRRLDDSRNSYMSMENSVRSSSPAVRLDVPTPQKPAMRSASRRAVSESLRKDAQLRQATLAHKENIDPNPPSKSNRKERRTLSEIHAKVRDSYDGSFLEDERPPAATTTTTRPTRFGNANISHQIADAVERASQEAYAKEVRRAKARVSANAGGDTGTQQSFLLPDLPNLSDLISGVYEDGTPVYTRQPRTRTTRFVSPPADATDASFSHEHMPLDAIPIPEDEKALFVSLRLLQDKVSELERAKADAEKKLEDMRQENTFLKGGKARQRERDSHGKRYELEQNDYKKDRLINENQKLESTNLALQNKMDLLERKCDIQEAALKKLSKERDMAVSQLGVAYLESQDLKSENETLREEITELKTRFAQLLTGPKTRDGTAQSEQNTASDASAEGDDSQLDTRRSTTKDATAKSTQSKSNSRKEDTRTRVLGQVDREISRLERERADEELFSIELPRVRESSMSKKQKATRPRPRSASAQTKKQSNTGRRVKRVVVEEVELTGPVDFTAEATGHTRKSSATEQDLTLLSFIDEREIAQLRKTLEEERLARKRRQSNPAPEHAADETDNLTRQSALKPAPRKSSLKETKVSVPRPASALGDLTGHSKASATEGESHLTIPAERQRRHSDHSVAAVAQRRRRRIAEEMTSAIILPDITLRHADLAENLTKLPEATQRALNRATQHNRKNCTVCKQSIPGEGCEHTSDAVKIPKPVPVSERMPEPSIYNEEPTLRPAQTPAVALATVLKSLEDELSHLRIQLVSYQGAYNKLDASISKRQRKALGEKIEKLLKDTDMKADQIYALYDVLEDQKQRGQEMTEQEMEVTLQSIGIDTNPRLGEVTGTTDKSSRKDDTDYGVDDDDSELPWEGIESTVEMTGGSRHN
ncbi:hypothetical protein BDW68DRAFT_20599 [Aspergillus falconensis]